MPRLAPSSKSQTLADFATDAVVAPARNVKKRRRKRSRCISTFFLARALWLTRESSAQPRVSLIILGLPCFLFPWNLLFGFCEWLLCWVVQRCISGILETCCLFPAAYQEQKSSSLLNMLIPTFFFHTIVRKEKSLDYHFSTFNTEQSF